jgi:translation initiation factor IF-3
VGPQPWRGRIDVQRGDEVACEHWFSGIGGLTIARRFQSARRETGKRLRINDLIRISPVRLIDENDGQVGVVNLDEAKDRARRASLDLVEVAPNSTPPVCRIMDYGKWKYHQKKKEQKNRSHARQSEMKGMRLRPKIDKHDLLIKVNKAREFLVEGHKVQFTMIYRGREMAHRDLGQRTMRQISETLGDLSKVETEPRMMHRRMTMVLAPDRAPRKVEAEPVETPDGDAAQTATP